MTTHNSATGWRLVSEISLLVICVMFCTLQAGAHDPKDSLYWGSKNPEFLIRTPIVCECWSSDQEKEEDKWTIMFDHTLIVRVTNLELFMKEVQGTSDIVLVLDNVLLEGIRAYSVNTLSNEVRFRIRLDAFDAEKRAEWANVFGPLSAFTKSVSVSIARSGGVPIATLINKRSRIAENVVRTAKSGEGYALNVVVVGPVRMWVSILAALLCIGVVLIAGLRTGIFRVSQVDQEKRAEAPYSLALVQMGFWYVVVLFSMLFLWVVTGSYVPMPGTVLGIIGISTMTGLVAGATDKRIITRTPIVADPSWPQSKKHRTFWRDMVTDSTGDWSLQRVQILIWNLLFGLYYAYQVYRTLTMPDIDESMLVLMGLSSTAYIGGKVT